MNFLGARELPVLIRRYEEQKCEHVRLVRVDQCEQCLLVPVFSKAVLATVVK